MKTLKILFSILIFIITFEVVCRFNLENRLNAKVAEFDSKRYNDNFYAIGEYILLDDTAPPPKIPHPFFGFAPEAASFEQFENYIPERRQNSFRIGIFGGSVAEAYASFLIDSQYFSNHLKDIPFLKNKTIEIINFAFAGYRQPASLMTSLLYGHTLDLVINLEGNNEIKNGTDGVFPIYYPEMAISSLYFSGLEKLKTIPEGISNAKKLRTFTRLSQIHWLPSFGRTIALAFLIQYQKRAVSWERQMSQTDKYFYKNEKSFPTEQDLAKFWAKSSCQQQNNLTDLGVPSMFFIQPLPYVENNKIMTPNEIQWLEKHNSKDLLGKLQYGVKEALTLMQKMKVNVFDYSIILAKESQELYVDGCCHLNEKGNEIVAHNMVLAIKNHLTKASLKRCNLDMLNSEKIN